MSLCSNKTCLLFMYFLGVFWEGYAVKITKLVVPDVIRSGKPVVLDCDYTLEDTADDGLVVKWYFNETPTPIYQWIPTRRPQGFGILKGRLNLNYSASRDNNSVYRALHIIHPGTDLSGEYTCSVSTFDSEDKKSKRMLVFVPEKSLELRHERVEDETLKVLCSAEGVYPTPNMSLHMGNSEVNGSVVTIQEMAGLFNIKATASIPALVAPEEFSCELHIPQANYTVRKETIYYPANDGNSFAPNVVVQLLLFNGLFFYTNVIFNLFGKCNPFTC